MVKGKHSVLVVDDEKLVVWSIQQELEEADYQVYVAQTGEEALKLASQHEPDVVLLDINLPDLSGLDVLKEIRRLELSSIVIMLTALADLNNAVASGREGAFDFVPKPFDLEDVKHRIEKALRQRQLESEVNEYRNRQRGSTERVIAQSKAMKEVIELVKRVATQSTSTVLILGESGVGKDVTARMTHNLSPRSKGPFIEINCPSFPSHLLESELFGHERGAFTDAKTRKQGLLEIAQGGTAFLNEIGDIDPSVQAKLLQVLEKKTFRRVGATQELEVDVRIIAATNQNLQQAVNEKNFRQDLFYRLNVLPIHIPPLRERVADIVPLAHYFVENLQQGVTKDLRTLSAESLEKLERYSWPGNARELRNVIERAILLARGPVIHVDDLPREIAECSLQREPVESRVEGDVSDDDGPWGALELGERNQILEALKDTAGNQSRAARILGISRDTLRYRLKKFSIPT